MNKNELIAPKTLNTMSLMELRQFAHRLEASGFQLNYKDIKETAIELGSDVTEQKAIFKSSIVKAQKTLPIGFGMGVWLPFKSFGQDQEYENTQDLLDSINSPNYSSQREYVKKLCPMKCIAFNGSHYADEMEDGEEKGIVHVRYDSEKDKFSVGKDTDKAFECEVEQRDDKIALVYMSRYYKLVSYISEKD